MENMQVISNTFESGVPYFDTINFPHGFHRGGDFNVKESEILTRCGQAIKNLMAGELSPDNPELENMLRVIKGETAPESPIEKAWIKYLNVIDKKRMGRHISLGGSVPGTNFEQDDFASIV